MKRYIKASIQFDQFDAKEWADYLKTNVYGYMEPEGYKELLAELESGQPASWVLEEVSDDLIHLGSYDAFLKFINYKEPEVAPIRFEFIVKRYGEPADVEVIIANSREEAENQLNNDGYVDWYEYHTPGKVYDPWETINEDDAGIIE